MEFVWWILIAVLFLLGFAGLLIPVLPDAPLLFLGFVIYHFLIDPDSLSMSFWIGALAVTAIVIITDYIAGGIAARSYGGSRWSIPAAIVGALVGIPIGPLGIILGPLVAVMIVEFIRQRDWKEALRAGFGTLVGFLGGVFVKGVLMAGLLVWFFVLVV
ncbi:DUF456 domain-containing protein [Melghirimyces algeriensis]|uniref:DUF456 domain-containing protein n=1 Tax=Melghirimyces algeriensis TaxID=910412 RepID=A0A521CC50_9BACL|nr:DUF456 domain-containing protein [Melghirimyces algeriensis]SMO56381.1 hypothetical protein SAMN06264849_103223 [Melghirimyces algeriensis]